MRLVTPLFSTVTPIQRLCGQDEEIAEVLDCSLSATKSLIHRGRETLKEKLKPYLQTGEWTE